MKEDISVEPLYSDDNLKGPMILVLFLKDFLVLNGFLYVSDPAANKTMHRMLNCSSKSEFDKA